MNFTYHPTLCAKEFGEYGIGNNITIKNGEFNNDAVYYGVVDNKINYSDLTGDGKNEAIIEIYCGSQLGNYSLDEIFIYTIRNGHPTILTATSQETIENDYFNYYSDGWVIWRISNIEANNGSLTIDTFADGLHCCPEYNVKFTYQWDGRQLVLKNEPLRTPF